MSNSGKREVTDPRLNQLRTGQAPNDATPAFTSWQEWFRTQQSSLGQAGQNVKETGLNRTSTTSTIAKPTSSFTESYNQLCVRQTQVPAVSTSTTSVMDWRNIQHFYSTQVVPNVRAPESNRTSTTSTIAKPTSSFTESYNQLRARQTQVPAVSISTTSQLRGNRTYLDMPTWQDRGPIFSGSPYTGLAQYQQQQAGKTSTAYEPPTSTSTPRATSSGSNARIGRHQALFPTSPLSESKQQPYLNKPRVKYSCKECQQNFPNLADYEFHLEEHKKYNAMREQLFQKYKQTGDAESARQLYRAILFKFPINPTSNVAIPELFGALESLPRKDDVQGNEKPPEKRRAGDEQCFEHKGQVSSPQRTPELIDLVSSPTAVEGEPIKSSDGESSDDEEQSLPKEKTEKSPPKEVSKAGNDETAEEGEKSPKPKESHNNETNSSSESSEDEEQSPSKKKCDEGTLCANEGEKSFEPEESDMTSQASSLSLILTDTSPQEISEETDKNSESSDDDEQSPPKKKSDEGTFCADEGEKSSEESDESASNASSHTSILTDSSSNKIDDKDTGNSGDGKSSEDEEQSPSKKKGDEGEKTSEESDESASNASSHTLILTDSSSNKIDDKDAGNSGDGKSSEDEEQSPPKKKGEEGSLCADEGEKTSEESDESASDASSHTLILTDSSPKEIEDNEADGEYSDDEEQSPPNKKYKKWFPSMAATLRMKGQRERRKSDEEGETDSSD